MVELAAQQDYDLSKVVLPMATALLAIVIKTAVERACKHATTNSS